MSSSASPLSVQDGHVVEDDERSSPSPPLIVIGWLMPLLRKPRVVSIVANTSSSRDTGERAACGATLKSWPIWKMSLPVAGVDRDRRARVVDEELVVAVAAPTMIARADVVVDALDRVVVEDVSGVRGVDQRDEGEPVVGRRRAEQEHVGVRFPCRRPSGSRRRPRGPSRRRSRASSCPAADQVHVVDGRPRPRRRA